MDLHLSNTAAELLAIAVLWDLIWRGIALWRSAHRDQAGWFVALLIINSIGLLPIFYILTHRTIAKDQS